MMTRPMQGSRGFALVGALWAVMVLSLAASSIITTSLTEVRLTHSRIKLAELNAAADAVVNIVLLRLLSVDPSSGLPVDGTPFTITFANYSARVSIQDEGGKIDLNFADRELLVRLMVSRGIGSVVAETLADRILDWREAGAGKRLLGAKIGDYQAAGLSYGPRNGPFESVDELRLVMSVTPELFDAIAPFVTVYGQTVWPNRDTAPVGVLRGLPGMSEFEIDAILRARASARQRQIAPSTTTLGEPLLIQALIRQGKIQANRLNVVRLTGALKEPIWVYR